MRNTNIKVKEYEKLNISYHTKNNFYRDQIIRRTKQFCEVNLSTNEYFLFKDQKILTGNCITVLLCSVGIDNLGLMIVVPLVPFTVANGPCNSDGRKTPGNIDGLVWNNSGLLRTPGS